MEAHCTTGARTIKSGTVPSGGLLLTAGADVQKDRIEVEIVGVGPRQGVLVRSTTACSKATPPGRRCGRSSRHCSTKRSQYVSGSNCRS